MAVTDNQPTNLNPLSPLGFRFQIKRIPNINYFCQSVVLPTITMNPIEMQSTPFGIIPRPGDRLMYDPFTLRFRVDEDLKNYIKELTDEIKRSELEVEKKLQLKEEAKKFFK